MSKEFYLIILKNVSPFFSPSKRTDICSGKNAINAEDEILNYFFKVFIISSNLACI